MTHKPTAKSFGNTYLLGNTFNRPSCQSKQFCPKKEQSSCIKLMIPINLYKAVISFRFIIFFLILFQWTAHAQVFIPYSFWSGVCFPEYNISTNSTSEFAAGTYLNTAWDGSKIGLSPLVTSGTYTTKIFDNSGCLSSTPDYFKWTTTHPFLKELPSSSSSESTTDYPQLPTSSLLNGQVALYRFNELSADQGQSGSDFSDHSGNLNHLNIQTGSVDFNRSTFFIAGASLSSATTKLRAFSSSSLNTNTDMSLSMFLRPYAYPNGSSSLISKGGSNDSLYSLWKLPYSSNIIWQPQSQLKFEIEAVGCNNNGQFGEGHTQTPLLTQSFGPAQSEYVFVSSFSNHTCAVNISGTVLCAGYNGYGQLGNGNTTNQTSLVSATGITQATQVAVGDNHSCALISDGTVRCWGRNDSGQLGDGTVTSPRTSPVNVIGVTQAVSVVAGQNFSCALIRDGTLRCWGLNTDGQLGDGTLTSPRSTPITTAVFSTSNPALQIAAGYTHACAIGFNGNAYCWGDNANGRLGDNTTVRKTSPVLVFGSDKYSYLSAGNTHSCGITQIGQAKCWGFGGNGRLGNGLTTQTTIPVSVTGLTSQVISIQAGNSHSCATTAVGESYCWGNNGSQKLGLGNNTDYTTPQKVIGSQSNLASIAGECNTVFLRSTTQTTGTSTTTLGSGDNTNNHFFANNTNTPYTPQKTREELLSLKSFAPNQEHICYVDSNSSAKCYGDGTYGRLGTGNNTSQVNPTQVVGLTSGVAKVCTSLYHSCALLDNGQIRCWGYNGYGQLGNNTTTNSNTPVTPIGLGTANDIACGYFHTCATLTSGQAQCWGYNGNSELGDGTTTNRSTPVSVSALTTAHKIDVGIYHTCAVLTTGQVRCWGYNGLGQLGDGTTTNRSTPVTVLDVGGATALTNASQIATTLYSTHIVTTSGIVKSWGYNGFGNLGDGTATNRTSAVLTSPSITNALKIDAGEYYVCSVLSDGLTKCWGQNNWGQLGDGSGTNRTTPTNASGDQYSDVFAGGYSTLFVRKAPIHGLISNRPLDLSRTYQFIAAKRSGNQYSLFINDQVSTKTVTEPTPATNTSDLYLGSSEILNTASPYIFDEVSLWNRALSDAEIQSVYQRYSSQLSWQIRICTDVTCSTNPAFVGPDNTSLTFFSELYNNSTPTNPATGLALSTLPQFNWTFFPLIDSVNSKFRYVQYRFFFNRLATTDTSPNLNSIKYKRK